MDFDFTDEQRLLKDSLDRLLADRYGIDARKTHATGPNGWSEDMWQAYADLGLLGLPFPEEMGGFGGGPVEMMIAAEAFGKALVLEPYFATAVLSGALLRHAADPALAAELVPQIAAGTLRLAAALYEPQSRYDLAAIETTATRDGDTWSLTGSKSLVLHGDSADALIVSATSPKGTSLFLVQSDASGLTRQGYPTQDALRAAEITLAETPARLIGPEGAASPVIARAADEACAFLAAEAVGCLQSCLDLTLDYLKTRQQFGTHIGAFQALQHRMAEMFVEVEQTRSLAMYATMMAASDDADERARAVSTAKCQAGEAGKLVGREAVQMHGGIGMTMEHAIGHYFKRLAMLDLTLGNSGHHLNRLASLGGLIREEV